jgi:hypothetical protein
VAGRPPGVLDAVRERRKRRGQLLRGVRGQGVARRCGCRSYARDPHAGLPPPGVPARRSNGTLAVVLGFGVLLVLVLGIGAIVASNLLRGGSIVPQLIRINAPISRTTAPR